MRKNYPDLSNNPFIETLLLRNKLSKLFLFLGFIILSLNSYGQNNGAEPVPFISANFDDLAVSKNTTGVCVSLPLLGLNCELSNENNLINGNLTDYATAKFGGVSIGASHLLRVTDNNTTYAAGAFAGFRIAAGGGVLSLNLLNGISVKTYNDDVLQEEFSGASLLNLNLLSASTADIVGFHTNKSFDAVEIVLNGGVSLLSSTRIYYAVIKQYTVGPALECNTITKLSNPVFPAAISESNTGMSGVTVGSISNAENAISPNDSDYATINLTVGLLASGSIAIKDQVTNYPAGTYAGFEIENTSLLSLAALGNVKVTTYLEGVVQDEFSGNDLVANVALLSPGSRFKLGFVSEKVFDEVKLSLNQTVGLNLGTTRVYGAIFQKFCAGPELPCNMQTALSVPTYPVYINNKNSGIDGLVCALCTVTNQDNLVDSNPANYASVNLSVGVGTTGSLSVKEQITNYPSGTFAAYTIENPALLTVGALGAVRITTYLDGQVQETKLGNEPLVSVSTDLLVGTGKQTIGFVATKAFDEVQITFQNLASVNLGEVKVYNAVFQKLCDPIVECNKSYVWSNPAFPVTVNSDNTGIDGVACVSCAVNNTNNLLTASTTDFANITLIAGVVGSGSVAVKDHLYTYPKGTFAGYVIKDLGTLAQVNLLQSLTISTYNNGVLQESRLAGQLIDLSLLGIDVLGSTPGVYNIGFKTNLAFDEIKLTLSSVASVINSINVYGAFVDTSESDGGSGSGLECNSSSISVTKDGTYFDANADGIVNVGDRVDYVFDIKNTGFETLRNISLTDNNATVTGTPIASLVAGANNTTNYTATYAITQADIDAGVVYNLATVNATTNLGTALTATSTDPTPCATCPVNPSCTNCTATPIVQTPKIALVKTAAVGGTGVLGNTITYTFTVTNTGNTTLNTIVVTDPMTGLIIPVNSITGLAPGATNNSITGTYVTTQADVNAGKVTNSATVTAKDPKNNTITDISGTAITNDDNTITPVTQTSKIALVKTASVGGTGTLGNTITYTFAVTNTGTTTLTNVIVTDTKAGLTIIGSPIASLAPGATNISIIGTYVITQADVDAGNVTNSAKVTAKDPQDIDIVDISGTTITTDDVTITPVGQRSTIALVKTANAATVRNLGDTITYTFAVTNTGTTTLTNVVVTDSKVGLTLSGGPITSLAPGITDDSITGTYVITQADVDAGKVTNSALVTARNPLNVEVRDISGTTLGTDNNTETPVNQTASIALVKTASVGGTGVLGNTITYTFTVTNTGTTTLNTIVVSDPLVGLTLTGGVIATLVPGASASRTGAYVITQADVDARKVTNSALVTAKDPQNNTITDVSGTSLTTNDSTVTPITQTPGIALVKTAVYNGDVTRAKVGDVITYTFLVRNTGTATLKNVTVTDPLAGLTLTGTPIASLAPGISNATIKGSYTITQADIDSGQVTNSALVTAQDPQNNSVTDISGTTLTTNDNTVTPIAQTPSIALVKTAVVGGTGVLGNTITYTFTVTNTGNTTLTDVAVTDPLPGLALSGNSIASLAPGASNATIKGTYVIKQSDIDAGRITNSAVVTAKDSENNTITDVSGTTLTTNDATVTPVTQTRAIALVKTAVVGGTGVLGNTITYTFTVTNRGTTTLKNIVVSDPLVGLTLTGSPIASLAPGVSNATIKGTYTITQVDIDAGKVTNSALVTAQDPQNNTITDISGTTLNTNDSTVTLVTQTPNIALVKTAVVGGTGILGDTITYTFSVTNTGNTNLTDIIVADPLVGLTLTGNSIASLEPGEINNSITGTYVITQANIDAGQVTNSALVTAQDPQNNTITDISGTTLTTNDSTVTLVTQTPKIALVKTAVVGGTGVLGNTITYTFEVTNTGNTTLNTIVVTDPMTGLVIPVNSITGLEPGDNKSITGTYVITQADVDAGKVTNSATVTAKDPKNNTITDVSGTTTTTDDNTVTPVAQTATIALVKTASVGGTGVLGNTITYTFAVTNTGTTTLTNVSVTDPKIGLVITGSPIASLAPGATNISITGTYVITQPDVNAGNVTNSAKVTAKDPQGVDVTDTSGMTINTDDETVTPVGQRSTIALVKTAVVGGTGVLGNTITYTFSVTNTGTTDLTNVVVTDPLPGLTLSGNTIASLAPGVTDDSITGAYVITQADVDAGKVTNSALVTARNPLNVEVKDISGTTIGTDDNTETLVTQTSKIALVKTAVVGGTGVLGNTITYTFTVTNTGTTTLNGIVVSDPLVGLTLTGGSIASLAPGATNNNSITGTYVITQADIDAGKVTNSALVTAKDPQNNTITDASGATLTTNESTVTPVTQTPGIALVKTAVYSGDTTRSKVGDVITYTFLVRNTGNTTLKDVTVTDPLAGLTIIGSPITSIAPGVSNATIKGSYAITQEDIDAGHVTNSALVTAQHPQNNPVTDTSGTAVDNDDKTITILSKEASLALVKTAIYYGDASKAAVGDKITYTFTVTNTGNVTVKNLGINDPKLGIANLNLSSATLAPLEKGTATADYFITQADIDAGKVTNSALVRGQDPQGFNVQDISGTTVNNDTSTETLIPSLASLALVKTAVYNGNPSKAAVGDIVNYTFTVTNTGNVTVNNLVINDAKLGISNLALVPGTLAPLEKSTITRSYTITQVDINAGQVTNTAIARGEDQHGVSVQDISGTTETTDDATVTILPKSASLAFVKTAVYSGDAARAKVGDIITYTFRVTNTGNVSVNNIVINDAKLGVTNLALVPAALAPLATGVVTRSYVITQADINTGNVTNTAIARGQDPQGVTVQDISGTAVDNNDSTVSILPKSASLAFVKTAVYNGNAAKAAVGDTVTYTFTVSNTGNVTINNIVIDDAQLGVTNLSLVPASLAPLATGVVTRNYTITQDNIDAANVTNTAIAKGQDPQGVPVQDQSGTAVDNNNATVTILPKSASLTFVKTGVYNGNSSKAVVGDIVTYTFRVTNTGNVTVNNIVINDAKLGASNLALVPAKLAPLAFGEITRNYTITQDDINAGEVTNTAIAIGQDPQGVPVQDRSGTTVDNDANTVTFLPKSASLAFVKTAVYKGNLAKAAVGDIVTYTFRVRNTGNVSVSNIVINDPKLGLTNLPLGTIASLATGVVTHDYAITQVDIDAGRVTNTAIAIGQDPQGIAVQDTSGTTEGNNDSTITLLPKSASLAFVKTGVYSGTGTKAAVGDKITYTFRVTNTGNVTVSNIVINDPKLGATNLPLAPATLVPFATAILTQQYTLSQTDVDAGSVTNTAIAKGQDPQGIPVQDISGTAVDNDDATITPLPENAKIALILKGEFQDENNDGQAQIGETIKYQYSVMNTGDVPLSNVWIEDEMLGHGMTNGSISMPIGAMDNSTFSTTYSITQADIMAGQVSNQAKVYGTSPLGVVVQDLSHETSELEDGFTVIGVDGCVVTVFNAVSPNVGSEYEKILYIRGLDCYPTNSVQIFDRWGVKVFDVDGYDNVNKAFRGISEGRATISQSKGLPSGTYFYVLKYASTDGKAFSKSGYLHLVND